MYKNPAKLALSLTKYLDQGVSYFAKSVSLTLLGLGIIKIYTVLANSNNPRPSLILNN